MEYLLGCSVGCIAVVYVGFSSTSYTVTEDTEASVCINVDGILSRELSIFLSVNQESIDEGTHCFVSGIDIYM